MIRTFYTMIVWKDYDDEEADDKMKGAGKEFIKRLEGYGLANFSMRTEIPATQPVYEEQYDEQQAPPQQQQAPPQQQQQQAPPPPPAEEFVQPQQAEVNESEVQDQM